MQGAGRRFAQLFTRALFVAVCLTVGVGSAGLTKPAHATDAARALADKFAAPDDSAVDPSDAQRRRDAEQKEIERRRAKLKDAQDRARARAHREAREAARLKAERARKARTAQDTAQPADQPTKPPTNPIAQRAHEQDIDRMLSKLRKRVEQAPSAQPETGIVNEPPVGVASDRNARRLLGLDPILPRNRRALPTGRALFGTDETRPPSTIEPGQPDMSGRPIGTARNPEGGEEKSTAWRDPETTPFGLSRVTILMVMKPGNKGIRRGNKTADPILCIAQRCYISRGTGTEARQMPRRKAFGTINTLGKRAGACRNSLTCAYRKIVVHEGSALVRPIDLRFVRHDRRERSVIRVDPTCRARRGRLQCAQAVQSKTYRLWVVPERVAEVAGPEGLERALLSGLAAPRTTSLQ